MADPDRNGTLRTAQNLGNLTRTITRRGTIGFNVRQNGRFVRDLNDFLKFRLTASSNVSITLDRLRQDADIELLNSSRRSLDIARAAGTTPDEIRVSGLAAGVYYVRVFPGISRAQTRYRVTVQPVQDLDGGSFATATDLGTVAKFNPSDISSTSPIAPTTLTNSIGFTTNSNPDTDDHYRFSLNSTSDLSVSISGLTADADLEIYDSSFTRIGSSDNSQAITDTVNLNSLPAGTYYARVYPFDGASTNYRLSLIASPTDGVNDNFTDSSLLGSGSLTGLGLSASNSVGALGDTNDFYLFSLGTGITSLRATLTGLADDADIQVFNGAFQKLGQSRNAGASPDTVVLTGLNNSDIYYIRIYPGVSGAQTNYTLNVTPT